MTKRPSPPPLSHPRFPRFRPRTLWRHFRTLAHHSVLVDSLFDAGMWSPIILPLQTRGTKSGAFAMGVSGLALPAAVVAIITALVTGPFDKCPAPVETTGQSVMLDALFGAGGALVLGTVVAVYGHVPRRAGIRIAVTYSVAATLLLVGVVLYAHHSTLTCP